MSFSIYPSGIIYDFRKRRQSGEFVLKAKPIVRVFYGLINGSAAGLIGFFALSLFFYGFPIIKEELLYRLNQRQIKITRVGFGDLLNQAEAQKISKVQKEAQSFGLNPNFSILIPKIGAKADITANVDMENEKEYDEALKKGVAHGKGTFFPGQGKKIFLFAHSTDSVFNIQKYNAIFFLLGKLEAGDQVILYFGDKKYIYEVTEKKIISPADTSFLKDKAEGEQLILQTCFPPGTTWQRLLVFGKLI